jgi:hypothetical protein
MSNDSDMHEAPPKTDNGETPQQTKTEFSLSRIIQAHKSDVKAVLATPQGTLISGSRDETVKLWVERLMCFCQFFIYSFLGRVLFTQPWNSLNMEDL